MSVLKKMYSVVLNWVSISEPPALLCLINRGTFVFMDCQYLDILYAVRPYCQQFVTQYNPVSQLAPFKATPCWHLDETPSISHNHLQGLM